MRMTSAATAAALMQPHAKTLSLLRQFGSLAWVEDGWMRHGPILDYLGSQVSICSTAGLGSSTAAARILRQSDPQTQASLPIEGPTPF